MLGPITISEFSSLFRTCKPPTGWPKAIGVAFSGGPDSLCLLYLLRSLLHHERRQLDCPTEIRALTVDHQLQPISTQHAAHCAAIAKSLNIQHDIYKIQWGEGSIPPRPDAHTPFEELARDIRYHGLLSWMEHNQLDTLAMGHHLDDQAETLLMNFSRGSRDLGLAGMRPCRRWGMGNYTQGSKYTSFGLRGMDSWIVRPLLSLSKRRIIETCMHHKLQFVEDPTNDEPSISPRNRIRYGFAHMNRSVNSKLEHINPARDYNESHLVPLLPPIKSRVDMYQHVNYWSQLREDIEEEADTFLRVARIPSPVSTFCLAPPFPHNKPILLKAVILRILRYVSPFPWGSPASEGGRSHTSLSRISETLRALDASETKARPFTRGGKVLWTPVKVIDGRVLRTFECKHRKARPAWLASRLPPARHETPSPVMVDLTHILRTQTNPRHVHLLWDNRFKVTCNLSLLDEHVRDGLARGTTSVLIKPKNKFFEPVAVSVGCGPNRSKEQVLETAAFEFKTVRTIDRL